MKSVTRGLCDARPPVTFPAAGHHRPLTGAKLYCLVTDACVCVCVWTTCPRLLAVSRTAGSRTRDLLSQAPWTVGGTKQATAAVDLATHTSVGLIHRILHTQWDRKKGNNFVLCASLFYYTWQKLMNFLAYIKESISHNSLYLILARVKNFV